jgi:flagellar biosynthesis anti-sigma factor FlgM
MGSDGAGEVDVKITGQPGAAPERIEPRRDVTANRGGEARGAEPRDRIELSAVAKSLSQLAREVGDVRAIDPERVAELRSRIAAGDFAPSNEDVATALLREVASDEGDPR